jgi:hypothetical protein
VTRSVAGELVRTGHLLRSLRLIPFAVGVLAAGAVLPLHQTDAASGIAVPRVAGLILVLGSGFVFDDAAAATLQASPYPLARRLWLRIGSAAAIVVPLWTLVLVGLLPPAPESARDATSRLSLALGLTVELLAALTVVWATAAWGRRLGMDEPGIATAPALLGLVFLGSVHPRAALLVGPGSQWPAAHLRWAAILVCAAALLAVAMRDVRNSTLSRRPYPGGRWRSEVVPHLGAGGDAELAQDVPDVHGGGTG